MGKLRARVAQSAAATEPAAEPAADVSSSMDEVESLEEQLEELREARPVMLLCSSEYEGGFFYARTGHSNALPPSPMHTISFTELGSPEEQLEE